MDVQVTIAEAVTILHPPISEARLRAVVQALGWRSTSSPQGGRGHVATYPWDRLSELHAALLPFIEKPAYTLARRSMSEPGS